MEGAQKSIRGDIPGMLPVLRDSLPKRCIKSAVRIPPHPALSPGIGGEGKGEGEIRDEDGIHRR